MKDATSGTTDILFAGDVHGRFDHLITAVRDYRPRALVLLGDLEAPELLTAMMAPLEALGTDVWFIPGNHDTDSAASWQHLEDRADRNLHGRVVTIAGVRIAGLGGVFREEIGDFMQEARYPSYADYLARAQPRRTFRPGAEEASQKAAGRLLKHRSSIFPDVYEGLLANTADILVTHEAPSCHPYGFTAIDKLARTLGVTRLFHGHHHDSRDYQAFEGILGFRAFGVGLRGISDSEGNRMRAGERAPARVQET